MITTAQQAELAAEVRKPRSLLKLNYDGGVFYMSTGGNVAWNNQNWLKNGFQLKTLVTGKGGIQSARFTINNQSYFLSEIAVKRRLNFQTVEYWEYYGTDPDLNDPVKRFSGEIIKIPSVDQTVVIDCSTKNGVTKYVPSLTLGSPDVNHLPYSGQRIQIGNEIFTVEIN